MQIIITGATGFIANHLIKHLYDCKCSITGFVREKKKSNKVHYKIWSLGDDVSTDELKDADCIVHLAHDFNTKDGNKTTTEGTLKLFQQASIAGIERQILISSYSASQDTNSKYGYSKYLLERDFLSKQQIVVRPGLVIGEGGIYGRIMKISQRWSILPLPSGGSYLLPVIPVDILAKRISEIIFMDNPRLENNLFHPQFMTLRSIVQKAAAEVGRKPVIIPIPTKIVMIGLYIVNYIGLKLPVNIDNLRGLIANQKIHHISSLDTNMEFLKNEPD